MSVLASLRCLQNYIPAHSLTLSCPVCRQTSILPEKGVAALQNNFFITNLMDVLQRTPGSCSQEAAALNSVANVAAGQLLSCPNHGGNVRVSDLRMDRIYNFRLQMASITWTDASCLALLLVERARVW